MSSLLSYKKNGLRQKRGSAEFYKSDWGIGKKRCAQTVCLAVLVERHSNGNECRNQEGNCDKLAYKTVLYTMGCKREVTCMRLMTGTLIAFLFSSLTLFMNVEGGKQKHGQYD